VLVIAALAVLGGGAYAVFQAEQALRAATDGRAGFDERSRIAERTTERLGASQQAYVAEGQGTPHWIAEAGRHMDELGAALELLASAAEADGARSAIQAATTALEDFRRLDRRAQQYLDDGQGLMASDLIFTEGLATLAAARDQIETARQRELRLLGLRISEARTRQLYAAAGAVALLVLALFFLAPVPQQELDVLTAMRALTTMPAARPMPAPAEPLARDEVSEVLSPATPAATREESEAVTPAAPIAAESGTASSGPSSPGVSLPAAASLCADLARVFEASELPALLARAAEIVTAPGLIVWVSDREGRELYPLLTHGYQPHVVMRLGTIPTAGDNATAAAWRDARLRTVPAADDAPGAIVAPIVTADGCVGVVSAEVQPGREREPEAQALLTIFAAQLATFVTTLPAGQGAEAARG